MISCSICACVNMSLREKSKLIRTVDVEETAAVVQQLVSKGRCPLGVPSGAAPPAPLSKRKRDAGKDLIYIRMLQCMPAISERVAKKIAEHFPTLSLFKEALADADNCLAIRLDDRTCLGAARLKKLRAQLCDIE